LPEISCKGSFLIVQTVVHAANRFFSFFALWGFLIFRLLCSVVAWCALIGSQAALAADSAGQGRRPNVLFLIIDDHPANMVSVLNESIVKTPNLERLAGRGTWFTRAYNAAPVCAASRAAFLTGVHPSRSGVYHNVHGWRRTKRPISKAESLQGYFLRQGYLTVGYGKIEHSSFQTDSVDDYTPGFRVLHRDKNHPGYSDAELAELAIPETVKIPDPSYMATRFGALPDDWDLDDPKKMQEDTQQANRTIEFLRQEHGQPFFLTCGFWRPHSERIVPKRYYDLYPLDELEIPVSYKENDLEDVPEVGRRWATRLGTHEAVLQSGLWKEYLRSFYAATSYIDEQIGRVLDALEASPYADNTILVLAGDNGFHGGEKDLWSKFALWDQTNRVVFGISVPGMPAQVLTDPVGLIDIYPTLLSLCGFEKAPSQGLDGVDLVPMLKGESKERGRPVLSTFTRASHSIRDARYRYIRYKGGEEELYDHDVDPYEWTNLANNPDFDGVKTDLARWFPQKNAPAIEHRSEWKGR
jgi:arylsulfatase A-like enzyme